MTLEQHIRSPVFEEEMKQYSPPRARPTPCYKSRKADCRSPCTWIVGTGCRPEAVVVPTRSLLEPSPRGDFQLVLKDVQRRAIEHMRIHDKLLIVFGTGMGKTITAISIALEYLASNPKSSVVVVCPKSLLDNFPKELRRHFGINNDTRFSYFTYGRFINQMAKKPTYCKNKLLIIDEAHTLRNPKTKGVTASIKCSSKASKRILLTATPFVNYRADLFSLASILNGQIVPADSSIAGTFTNKVIYAPKVVDPRFFPSYSEENVFLTMSRAYERGIDKAFDSQYANPELFLHGYRQIVNALKPDDEEEYLSLKMPFVMETIQRDPSKQNLIYTNWLEQGIDIVCAELDRYNVSHAIITGAVRERDRNSRVEEFNAGQINTLVISNAGSEGLDLKGVENVFVIDPPWNPAGIDQVIGRAIRYNSHAHLPANKRHVSIYYLILQQQQIDERVRPISGDVLLYAIIGRKRREQDELLQELASISV
jgi:superfamily II DNA or RNA helicase